MKLTFIFAIAIACLAGCNGGNNSSSSDQNDPGQDDSTSPTNAKVECLKQNLSNLPADMKKVIELSANAVVKCKANKPDVEAFLEKLEN